MTLPYISDDIESFLQDPYNQNKYTVPTMTVKYPPVIVPTDYAVAQLQQKYYTDYNGLPVFNTSIQTQTPIQPSVYNGLNYVGPTGYNVSGLTNPVNPIGVNITNTTGLPINVTTGVAIPNNSYNINPYNISPYGINPYNVNPYNISPYGINAYGNNYGINNLGINPNIDPTIQRRITKYFYAKLIDKWLYNDPIFDSLLKYLKIDKKEGEASVGLISSKDLSKMKENNKISDIDANLMKQFIEVIFLNKKMVYHILRDYVNKTNMNWYDLYHNSRIIKKIIRHKLKKRIIRTIFEIDLKTKTNDKS
jgi:hypothetical protein